MNIKTIMPILLLASSSAFADVAVIVHPSNADALDGDTISRIFLGKAKSFPSGDSAIPVNQSNDLCAQFNDKVINKSASQLKAYWSKLVFTGKGTPPKEVTSDADVIALVAADPSVIGYVDPNSVDASVKVVSTF